MHTKTRIAIPEPTSFDPAYNQRGWPQYAHAVECCGGVAVPIPLTETLESTAEIVSGCAAILLPGSPADIRASRFGQERNPVSADPDLVRESVDDLLLRDAFTFEKPVLGICYGMQSMNVWCRGALNQHIPGTGVDHAPGRTVHEAHSVRLEPGSRLAAILGGSGPLDPHVEVTEAGPPALEGALMVNSSHHQAVSSPGSGLSVVARCAEDGLIEALEGQLRSHFVFGVQWHPERTFGVHSSSRLLFSAFVTAAQDWKNRHQASPSGLQAISV